MSELLDVAVLPRLHTSFHTLTLGVEMAGTACKTLGHLLGMSVEELTWNIAKESFTQFLQMDILVGLHHPSCRLTL